MYFIGNVDENPCLARTDLVHQDWRPNPEDSVGVILTGKVGMYHFETPEPGLGFWSAGDELRPEIGRTTVGENSERCAVLHNVLDPAMPHPKVAREQTSVDTDPECEQTAPRTAPVVSCLNSSTAVVSRSVTFGSLATARRRFETNFPW